MKIISTLTLLLGMCIGATAQTTITNGGFELWGNTSPGLSSEPTNWYSDQSGSTIAALGPQTCFQTSSSPSPHSGTYCAKIETESYLAIETVNGVITTGVVNAPSTDKSLGYIGTINYTNASDIRRMAFTGKPDSLVGWYQYTPGASTERGKIRAILHIGNYFDPETPTTYHPDPSDSEIASALFLTDTPGTTVSTWTRFSVPFVYTTGRYASGMTPAYIMINVTPSANQATTVNHSILYLDDLQAVYAPVTCATVSGVATSAITATSATISWTAVPGSLGYVYAVDMSITPPALGTFTTGTSASITGLTAGTAYYAHVYDSCAVGSSSGWVTVPFATTSASGCNAVTGLAASSITTTSATITWSAPAGSVGAEYEINTTATDPTDNGTATTASTYNATGLTPTTSYYAHVRDSCGATSLSAWVTIPFTTLNPAGVHTIPNNNFGITAFPNPVKVELTVNIAGVAGNYGQVQLMDMSGRVINTVPANGNTLSISMNGLSSGIYFVRYIDATHTQTIKITKE